MSFLEIEESSMVFSFPTEDLFHIEKSPTYRSLQEGLKTVEMILTRKEQICFIEAKTSAPNPINRANFDPFINNICSKFRDSVLLYWGLLLERPYSIPSSLPRNHTREHLRTAQIRLLLILKDFKEDWLIPIRDALDQSLYTFKKCLGSAQVLVLNDSQAKQHQLIKS